MSYSVQALYDLTDEELVKKHDAAASSTQVGVSYFLAEIRNREQAKANQAMGRLTMWIFSLTAVVTIATLINLALFAFQFLK